MRSVRRRAVSALMTLSMVALLVGSPTTAAASVAADRPAGGSEPGVLHSATAPGVGAFVAVTPARLADTRPGEATIDQQVAGVGAVGADEALAVPVAGRAGVPSLGAAAVALNVTAVGATAPSYLTVHPSGGTRPLASNLNLADGGAVSNMVIAKVGSNGAVSVYNAAGTTEVIVDVLGWFPAGAGFTPLEPARLADTRPGQPTVDLRIAGVGAVAGGSALQVPVGGRTGIPSDGAAAVAVNVTALAATEPTYLTVHPAGGALPHASHLNVSPGETVTNMVIAKVGSNGAVSVYNAAGTTHVIVDVLGWFPAGAGFTPLEPARLADTRPGQPTVDLRIAGTGALEAGGVLHVPVPGRASVPGAGVGTVALNVTALGASAPTYLTVHPTGGVRPHTSNVNVTPGRTVSTMVMARLGHDGSVTIYNAAGTTHVIVDVLGWFPGTPDPSAGRWVVPSGRPVRVQFMGDSVTEGVARSPGGLPTVPWLMRGLGYDVAMVGTLTDHGIGHDGHGGACLDDRNGRCLHTSAFKGIGLLQSTPGWLPWTAPDVIVVNAGNNDRYVVDGWYTRPDLVADAMGRLIDSMASSAPQAMVLVTRLMFETDLTGGTDNRTINDLYARVIAEKAAAGRNVRFIDAYREITSTSAFSSDPGDIVHLSDTGTAAYARGASLEMKAVFDAARG